MFENRKKVGRNVGKRTSVEMIKSTIRMLVRRRGRIDHVSQKCLQVCLWSTVVLPIDELNHDLNSLENARNNPDQL
ncbi:hypothetical protein AGABI2DRAFT_191505 [Agaricus bisporus var. bisporus H97]|uniref:hypothetical protein n=1 Tax=Agaricus bisporus var. bisporus (strain H97 / ATCC MYA-4626 / FGSC 10389) TaxID=936046 RepID=UPI00029F6699|nr:hypothetical protein AGABI2DRAFT_191505 [Agaricus bisporus var. bisporus H97]EKV49492.1 hypothetical protein AGABI2DRAFT_191505 [Agaricus bisporus var. bisporus H97]